MAYDLVSANQVVFVKDGEVRTDSLKVAEKFGKQHGHVLRDIERLECSEEFRRSNFGESSYLNSQNKSQRLIEMTFDGFMFLAMGFTGSEAAKVKEWYISQFNAMRRELQERAAVPAIDLNSKISSKTSTCRIQFM